MPTTNKKSASKAKNVPEVEDAEDVDDSEPEPVKDISNETYSLHKSVVLRDTVIVGDTDFLKHEEFDYHQFETYNIRKLNDAAEKGKFTFEYVSGTATIMAKGVRICNNITITVEDNHEWKKVEKGIE
jgi:CBS domain containing-hemolysin-like protein